MKRTILIASLLLPMMMSAKSPDLVNPPAPRPAGVRVVSPDQGLVDLSGDKSPKGVGEISFTFSSTDIKIAEGMKAELWKEGELYRYNVSAYVDAMGNPLASIFFGACTKPGWYEVKIPEGFFVVSGHTIEAFSLFYQIDEPFSIYPAPGVVEDLSELVFKFVDCDQIVINNRAVSTIFPLGVLDSNNNSYNIIPKVDNAEHCVYLKFDNNGIAAYLTEPATYSIDIPAGYLEARVWGPNYATDPTDYVAHVNPRYTLKYIIPSYPQPDCDPESGTEVDGFYSFSLTLPRGAELQFVNDRSTSGIYPMNPDGTVDMSEMVYALKLKEATNDDTGEGPSCDKTNGIVTYFLYDTANNVFYSKPQTPAPGEYAFVCDAGSFTVNWTGLSGNTEWFVQNAPFRYLYTVRNNSTAVEEIEEAENFNVYSVTGLTVGRNMSKEAVEALAPGFYIVNGRKVMKVAQ